MSTRKNEDYISSQQFNSKLKIHNMKDKFEAFQQVTNEFHNTIESSKHAKYLYTQSNGPYSNKLRRRGSSNPSKKGVYSTDNQTVLNVSDIGSAIKKRSKKRKSMKKSKSLANISVSMEQSGGWDLRNNDYSLLIQSQGVDNNLN